MLKCPSCTKNVWKLDDFGMLDGAYKMNAVVCAGCGHIAGVTPYYDPGVLAKDNQTTLKKHGELLKRIMAALRA